MAAINDLISQIQDSALSAKLEAEVNKLSKQKKFVLGFEEHLPECTRLCDIPITKGSLVEMKSSNNEEHYFVIKVKGNTAICVPKNSR